MEPQPREALDRLIAAFEHHLDVARAASSANSRALEEAEERLSDAFFTYDDVLFRAHGIELPFDILDEDELDDYEDEDEDDLDDEEDEDADLDDSDEDDDFVDVDAD